MKTVKGKLKNWRKGTERRSGVDRENLKKYIQKINADKILENIHLWEQDLRSKEK